MRMCRKFFNSLHLHNEGKEIKRWSHRNFQDCSEFLWPPQETDHFLQATNTHLKGYEFKLSGTVFWKIPIRTPFLIVSWISELFPWNYCRIEYFHVQIRPLIWSLTFHFNFTLLTIYSGFQGAHDRSLFLFCIFDCLIFPSFMCDELFVTVIVYNTACALLCNCLLLNVHYSFGLMWRRFNLFILHAPEEFVCGKRGSFWTG